MRRRGFIFALLLTVVFLLAAAYFFLTGSFFLTRIVLPWISNETGTEITVRQATLRLFSGRIILHDFRMGVNDQPFLTIRRARGTMLFLPLLRGRLEFSDVELTQAHLKVVRDADGNWCRKELGDAFFRDDDPGASTGASSFQLVLQQVSAEDSAIEIKVNDKKRDFTILFSEFNGIAENYRQSGSMVLKCASRVHIGGRAGMDLSSDAEWNGELDWGEDFSLIGAHGVLNLPQLNGELDGTRLPGAGLLCQLLARRQSNDQWEFPHMRLVRQKLSGVTDLVELSGYCHQAPLRYELELLRCETSGNCLSLLSEISCGIRPGDMEIKLRGHISGDSEQFRSTLAGQISRQAGPAYFGAEKVMLPDFKLTLAHDIGFNWQTCRSTVKKLDTQLSSGGKLCLQTSILPNQTLQYRAQDLDVQFLRLCCPYFGDTIPVGGKLSGQGELQILRGPRADTLSAQGELQWKNARLQQDGIQSLPFDAGLNTRLQLPLSNGLLKLDPLQITVNDGKDLKLNMTGSLPLRRDYASLDWQLTAAPEKILPLLNQQSLAGVTAFLQPFAPLQLTGSGKLDLAPDELKLMKTQFTMTGKNHGKLAISMPTHRYSLLPGSPVQWKWNFDSTLPAAMLPPLSAETAVTGGECRIQGKVEHNTDFSSWNMTANASWQELAGRLFGKPFAEISGGTELNIQANPDGEFSLNRAAMFCRVRNNPALRLENYGNGNFNKGDYAGTMQIRYANETLLNLLLPWNLTAGQCSGTVQLSGNWKSDRYRLQSYLVFRQLLTAALTQPVSGEWNCEFRKAPNTVRIPQSKLELTQENGHRIAEVRMTMLSADAAPIRFHLSSPELDLSKLHALFGTTGSSGEIPTAHTAFDWGARQIVWDLQLDKCYWVPEVPVALSGSISMQRNRFQIPRLQLSSGGGKLELQANGMDFPTGMMMNISARMLSPMQLKPLSSWCWPESRLTGILQDGDLQIQFRRLYTANWQDDLVGLLRLKFKDLDLPAADAGGPLSRALLFPLETMIRAEKIIPQTMDVRSHFKKLWESDFSSQSPFARLKFSNGDLQLQADGGRLQIQKMKFTGEPVTQLEVSGYSIPRENGELHLDFAASLCGVRIRIPLRGTISEPKVAKWQIFEANLAAWSDMLGFTKVTDNQVTFPIFSPLGRMIRDWSNYQSGSNP